MSKGTEAGLTLEVADAMRQAAGETSTPVKDAPADDAWFAAHAAAIAIATRCRSWPFALPDAVLSVWTQVAE